MSVNPYDSHLETQVLSASPVELVQLLYRGAIDALAAARLHLAAGDIPARAGAVTRAMNLVGELTQALDPDRGGDLASQLRDLYSYILRRIHEGNYQQQDAPFEEASRLLTTLLDAWQSIEQPVDPYNSAPVEEPERLSRSLSLTA
ncbi:MAG: flagellar export chaperone FliS [Bryobacteraceae bacterium]|nr:flagellar export chaperone FliS [Bryobacteraceae bacterium]